MGSRLGSVGQQTARPAGSDDVLVALCQFGPFVVEVSLTAVRAPYLSFWSASNVGPAGPTYKPPSALSASMGCFVYPSSCLVYMLFSDLASSLLHSLSLSRRKAALVAWEAPSANGAYSGRLPQTTSVGTGPLSSRKAGTPSPSMSPTPVKPYLVSRPPS